MKRIFYVITAAIIFSSLLFTYSQPAPPTELTATEAQNMMHPSFVRLEWTPSTAYSLFNVYRKEIVNDTGSYVVRYKGLMHSAFNDYRVQPGKTYAYYVTAVNLDGQSAPSNEVQITLGGTVVQANVTGIIRDEGTLNGIPNATAVFFRTMGMELGFPVRTTPEGLFNIALPVGTYYLKTMAYGYKPEFYDNVRYLTNASKIEVTSGSNLNFDISLTPYETPVLYTLTGSVKDSLGNPLRAGVGIFGVRNNSHHHSMRFARTDSLGNYSLPVREGDTVVVFAASGDRNYFPEFWDNKSTFMDADRIFINGNITNIDFVLQHRPVYPNGIAGFVKDISGEPVESFVSAIRKGSTYPFKRYTVATDSLGEYSFSNLLPGKYILLSIPREGYIPAFFTYNGNPTLRWREADSVIVTESSLITGIDFTVQPVPESGEGSITGIVTNYSGQVVEGAFVYVINSYGDYAGYGLTDSKGQYRVIDLNPGEYKVVCDRIEYNNGTIVNTTIDYQTNPEPTVNLSIQPETVTDIKDKPETVSRFQLFQNYPNPFNPSTKIKFSVPEKTHVRITVYNLLGIQVAQLMNEVKDAGEYNINFNGSGLTSGVYFYKMEAGKYTATKKLTLLK